MQASQPEDIIRSHDLSLIGHNIYICEYQWRFLYVCGIYNKETEIVG